MSSVSRAELAAMDRDELIETVAELSETVENMRAVIDTLLDERDRLDDRVDDLEGELRESEQRLHRERSKLMRRVAAIEDELDIEPSRAVAIAEGGHEDAQMSKLARLMRHGPEAVVEQPTQKHRRAKTIVDNFDRWGEQGGTNKDSVSGMDSGVRTWTLKTREHDLKTRLEDARNESLQWTQVYRAMEVIDEWSDAVRLKDNSGTGKTLTLRVEVDDD